MNVNPLIMRLSNVTGYPVAPDIYRGDSDKWIVFTCTDERANLYADDEEIYTTARFYVSFYCPHTYNYMADKKKIKNALLELGFIVESVSSYVEEKMDGSDFIRRTLFQVNYTTIMEE